MNIIFAGACSTAGSQATMPPPVLGSNGAYVGFDRLAWVVGIQDASVAFWAALQNGRKVPSGRDHTVAGAVLEAQAAYNTRHRANAMLPGNGNVPLARLKVVGDLNTTLSVLYLAPFPGAWLVGL